MQYTCRFSVQQVALLFFLTNKTKENIIKSGQNPVYFRITSVSYT